MASFPFTKLPPEVQNMIRFESGLDKRARLALLIALNKPDDECAIVNNFLLGEDNFDERILAAIQTIYYTGATKGSANWARYAACKQMLYDNPELKTDMSRFAIKYKDWEDAACLAEWVQFIGWACDYNWEMWGAVAEDPDDFYSWTQDSKPSYKPSNTEIQRIVLAVVQFKAYFSLLGVGPDAMAFEEATQVAASFFRNLTPWEKEQIVSIPNIIHHVFRDDIDSIIEDYHGFEGFMDKAYLRLLTHPISKRLIRFIEEKANLDLNERDTKMVWLGFRLAQWRDYYPPSFVLDQVIGADEEDDVERMGLYEYVFGYPITWAGLLQMWTCSREEEDLAMIGCEGLEDSTPANQEAHSRLLNLSHDRDRDAGPRESWKRWYVRFRGEDRHFFASEKLSRLRSTGYIFWDEARMRRHWTATERPADEFSDSDMATPSPAESSSGSDISSGSEAPSNEETLNQEEERSEREEETADGSEAPSDGEPSGQEDA